MREKHFITVGHYDPGSLTAGAGNELADKLMEMGDRALERAENRRRARHNDGTCDPERCPICNDVLAEPWN